MLGTSLDLQIEAENNSKALIAEQRALCEIDRLEMVFSRYDERSEFRRWQEDPGIAAPLSPELFDVLELCAVWKRRSAGAFDPAGEAYLELWRVSAKENRAPTDAEIAKLRRETAEPAWRLDSKARTGTRLGSYALSLNSVAKGYIIDAACDAALQSDGVRGVVVNIGGDLRVAGDKPKRVGITDPFRDAENAAPASVVSLKNAALATSGNGRRGFAVLGVWHSHIIDPRTGYPAKQVCSASVFAPDAVTADILATVFSIEPPEQTLAMVDTLPDVGCLLIEQDGTVHQSDSWKKIALA